MLRKKQLIQLSVVIVIVGILLIIIGIKSNEVKPLWYGKDLPSYFEKGYNWNKLNKKEQKYVTNFKNGEKLKIIDKELYNQPFEGTNKFTSEGTYVECNEGECSVDLYYYDGVYIYFLPIQSANDKLESKYQKENKIKVLENTEDCLIVDNDDRHKYCTYSYYHKNKDKLSHDDFM